MTARSDIRSAARRVAAAAAAALLLVGVAAVRANEAGTPSPDAARIRSLRCAVEDLSRTHGPRYPGAPGYLRRLSEIEALGRSTVDAGKAASVEDQFRRLQREALLAHPLLADLKVLVVKRRIRRLPGARVLYAITGARPAPAGNGLDLGMPSNHECNSSLPRTGWDNEIALLSLSAPDGELKPVHRPSHGGYVGEVELHPDGERLLFTQSDRENWKIWEIRRDGTGLRQVSRMPADVDAFDACWLPDGGIMFGSTASYQSVPCWHGQRHVSNLYRMDADGGNVRQICFDQDHDFHPVVLPNGQVLYNRWEYAGISHIYLRLLMVMNPDGTAQRGIYGSNSWFPNSLYFARPLPEGGNRLVCILSGYHGVHRMGQLVVLDAGKGWYEAEGIVQRISGRGDPVRVKVRDNLVDDDWPRFLHPYPLDARHFLVACLPDPRSSWGLYLADTHDNLVCLREEPGCALLEPVPLRPRPKAPVIPPRVDPAREDGMVYLHDIHRGPGLEGVPRGAVKSLRVFAYHFGYRGLAGPDKIGLGGPWEVMRIVGTVPLESDGSAFFRAPARTPLAVQALDAEGRAVQLMRSWFCVQPGESASCIGCHESPADVPATRTGLAARRPPREITPWRGPMRGFDFVREVQPMLDAHCIGCHDGRPDRPDLRRAEKATGYVGRRWSDLEVKRLPPAMLEATRGMARTSPAYESLVTRVRRVGIEDDVSLLVPGEYHADTSPLIQMLRKGHQDVRLDADDWDRLATWIDLNAPFFGTWGQVFPIPDGAHERRMELRRMYGGPLDDPEKRAGIEDGNRRAGLGPPPDPVERGSPARWLNAAMERIGLGGPPRPAAGKAAEPRTASAEPAHEEKAVSLGDGVALRLVRIPQGEFVFGDDRGEADERPSVRVTISRAFWMSACEISNEQFQRFRPSHDPRYYAKRHATGDDRGLPFNGPQQPVVRVSWDDAMACCEWLSEQTGLRFTLPTESQWEYACRAGSAAPFAWGGADEDFSPWANLADRSFGGGLVKDGKQITGGLEHLVLDGAALADGRFSDGAVVTAPVGSYRANAWGLHDMHGNAAEWTRSAYRPTLSAVEPEEWAGTRRVVRGGSFYDPPSRARSAVRLAYPPWQRVFNVGFRVVCEEIQKDGKTDGRLSAQ